MATDIAGLFGLTPQMYEQGIRQSAMNEGSAYARMAPEDRAIAGIYSAGASLGRAGGGLLGIEDPQMKLISARQQIIGQLDQTDPASLLKGAQMLTQMGDQQGAFALADYARKAQESIALAQQRMRERAAADPFQQLLRTGKYTPESLAEFERTGKSQDLVLYEKPEKPEKDLRFGVDREAIAGEMYDNKPFAQLTPTEKAAVNKRVEAEKPRTTITNVMPGDKSLDTIPAFRASVQRTIEPQSKAVFSADNALVNIQDSIDTNNFTSFRAAQTQFARAISGSGDLSQKELLAAGADPALIGGTADYLAKLFTSTPTLDTQEKMKKTLLAIKKVSTDKANAEIETQRKIAYGNPNYDRTRVDQALSFPEFSGKNIAIPDTGDLAAQARALLKQRQEAKK